MVLPEMVDDFLHLLFYITAQAFSKCILRNIAVQHALQRNDVFSHNSTILSGINKRW